MTYNSDIHHRRSIRLRNFDYASAGAYFVTICAQGRECLFGEVVDGVMAANDAGRMVEKWWCELALKFPLVEPDSFVTMPNHFHGIIFLVGADLCVRPDLLDRPSEIGHTHRCAPTQDIKSGVHAGASLPTIIQWFKTMTTNEYMKNVSQSAWPPFPGRLWQRNYFERVIRNDAELDKFRNYILHNPARWTEDEENPLTFSGRRTDV
jgi:REP element-mobilizing transposase RayT